MSYTVRNTIILGVIMFLILAGGVYFSMFRLPGQLKALEASIRKIDVELQNTPDLLNQRNTLQELLAETERQWATRVKAIPAENKTGDTYDYLIRTIDVSGQVRMDMVYKGIKNFNNYGFGGYDLKGNAPFDDFFRFLWHIENGNNLFKVRTIDLKQAWTKEADSPEPILLVSYHMLVEAYFSSIPELSIATAPQTLQPARPALNPFYPSILPEIPPNVRDLVEIKRSILKGVIPGRAYVQDQRNRMRELGEGDEIYLGYISRIDPQRGRIEYVLNEGGIIDRGELFIRHGEPTQ